MALAGRPAVFLDKDGTLVDNVPYNIDPARIQLAAGAVDGLRLLHEAGFPLVVITNQSGIARGYFTEAALTRVQEHLHGLLAEAGVPLAGFYYCPHLPDAIDQRYAADCDCRKPRPGLFLRAAERLGLDCTRSWAIGDILHDVEAGHRAGCRAILIDNGNETEWELSPARTPDLVARDLVEAASQIVAQRSAHPVPHRSLAEQV